MNKDGVLEQDIELFSQDESTKRVLKASSAADVMEKLLSH